MSQTRKIVTRSVSRVTMEGAGVRLYRAFGYHEKPAFDPFLMFDDFRVDNPSDYLSGFPWHPHRGIETVTYMLEGTVEHGDSMGHSGNVNAGGVSMDDCRIRHYPPGDAQTDQRADGRFSALD